MGLGYANPAIGFTDREVLPQFYDSDAEVIASWGSQLVRVSFSSTWFNTDAAYRGFIRQWADACTSRGIYIIIDCHYRDAMESMWFSDMSEAEANALVEPMMVALERVARDYADEPMLIGVEINEPYPMDNIPEKQHIWMMKMYNRLAQRIHAINPDLKIFMDVSNFMWISDAVLEEGKQYLTEPHLVMSPHIYEAIHGFQYKGKYWPDDGSDFFSYYQAGNYAEAKTRFYLFLDLYYKKSLDVYGLPVVVTEFQGRNDMPEPLIDLMEYMNSHGWGYAYYSYFGQVGNDIYSLLKADWKTLSPTGEVFVDHLEPTPIPLIDLDLQVIAAGGLAVADAALVGFYLLKYFKVIE